MRETLISIDKIVFPGKALGRGSDGVATFVEGALPGEVVKCLIRKDKKSFREGFITEIIQRSNERINPICPSFGECGGCSFQHTDYKNQVKIKDLYVQELIKPFVIDMLPILESPIIWNYRNKMEFSFFQQDSVINIGLHRRDRFDQFVKIPPCFISDNDMISIVEQILKIVNNSSLKAYNKKEHRGVFRHLVIRKGFYTKQVLTNIVTTSQCGINEEYFKTLICILNNSSNSFLWTVNNSFSDAVINESFFKLFGKGYINEELNIFGKRYTFQISPFSFFQTNTLSTELLYGKIIEFLAPSPEDNILDLYSGMGTIGIILSPYVKSITCVEQNKESVESGIINCNSNNVNNLSFYNIPVEVWVREFKEKRFDGVILDPPRGGIAPSIVKFLIESRPSKIIYISCNPSTLARDLKILKDTGLYRIIKAQTIDMFPQTYHAEVIVYINII